MSRYFSWARFGAVLVKEFVQMRRDRLTFAMIVGIPIMQLILFGFAINTDPKALPTAVLAADNSVFARSLVRGDGEQRLFPGATGNSRPKRRPSARSRAARCSSCSPFPENFARKLVRGERPVLLVEADATDPAATSNALAALVTARPDRARARPRRRRSRTSSATRPPFEVRVHRRYNPEGITAVQHRARADRHHPHHDHGDDDRRSP